MCLVCVCALIVYLFCFFISSAKDYVFTPVHLFFFVGLFVYKITQKQPNRFPRNLV